MKDKNLDTKPVMRDSKDEIAELRDKYLRAMAELENTRKRAAVDIENVARGRAISIAEQFLPLVDAIDKASLLAPNDEGIIVLKKASDNTLAKLGIVRMETIGQIMNPLFHNAVSTIESDKPQNTIVEEMQAGFMFGDSVLRTAMVIVSKGESDESK